MTLSSAPASTPAAMQWDSLAPGFADPVHDSQATFRILLDALARPGRIQHIDVALDAQASGTPRAAVAALYALCDFATPVWLAQENPALASALRFHTGAPLTTNPAQAAFAWIADALTVPPLDQFALGDPETPEYSTTLLIQVESLSTGANLRLSGPGIEHTETLAPRGLPDGFWQQRAALAGLFPCGVDLYLVCDDAVVGVPRTTRVEEI